MLEALVKCPRCMNAFSVVKESISHREQCYCSKCNMKFIMLIHTINISFYKKDLFDLLDQTKTEIEARDLTNPRAVVSKVEKYFNRKGEK